MPGEPTLPPGEQPLIPERLLDVPSQRLYYLSLGLLLQVSGFKTVFKFFLLEVSSRIPCLVHATKTSRV